MLELDKATVKTIKFTEYPDVFKKSLLFSYFLFVFNFLFKLLINIICVGFSKERLYNLGTI